MKWRFALAAVSLSFVLAVVAFFAADTYAHARFDGVVGLNRAGYRGVLVGAKFAGEKRIVVLGGSTAFGYGVSWQEAWPEQLAHLLQASQSKTNQEGRWYPHDARDEEMRRIADKYAPPLPFFRVVNLGYNAEGAAAFRPTLEDFAYLKPDLIILYEGYNDLAGSDGYGVVNSQVYRRQSPLFRWTGYYAILPLVLHEKWLAVSSGGHLDEAYRDQRVVFHPTISQRTEGALLRVADVAARTATGPLTMPPPPHVTVALIAPYLQHVEDAVLWAHDHNVNLLMVGQPLIRADHRRQQTALIEKIESFRDWVPTVRYVGLGDSLNLSDHALAMDGMHLTAEGNRRIAEAVAPAVRDLLP